MSERVVTVVAEGGNHRFHYKRDGKDHSIPAIMAHAGDFPVGTKITISEPEPEQ